MLELSRNLVMISVREMDRLAAEALAVGRDLFNTAHAKVPKEIERIVLLDVRVHPIQDARIHLFRARKRTIAVADDVEVPEVKIRREPRIGHISIMKDRLLERRLCPGSIQIRTREDTVVTTGPAYSGDAVASQDEPEMSPRSAGSLSSISFHNGTLSTRRRLTIGRVQRGLLIRKERPSGPE